MATTRFEIVYLLVAPVTFWMLVQFIILAWLDKRLPRWAFSPLIAVFVIQDVLYNALIGSWLFRERPREWLFTDRLKRHGLDPRVARFATVLNFYDKGHV